MINVGIIGSAGRGEDLKRLNLEMVTKMRVIALGIINQVRGTSSVCLVSGGAAFSDHIAVDLYFSSLTIEGDRVIDDLLLHLPAPFNKGEFHFLSTSFFDPGKIANYYHRNVSEKLLGYENRNRSLREIEYIVKCCRYTVSQGFKKRNALVVKDSDYLIAFTFGDGARLKDGGTAHTMGLFLRDKNPERSFHVDLNDMKIYSPAVVV